MIAVECAGAASGILSSPFGDCGLLTRREIKGFTSGFFAVDMFSTSCGCTLGGASSIGNSLTEISSGDSDLVFRMSRSSVLK